MEVPEHSPHTRMRSGRSWEPRNVRASEQDDRSTIHAGPRKEHRGLRHRLYQFKICAGGPGREPYTTTHLTARRCMAPTPGTHSSASARQTALGPTIPTFRWFTERLRARPENRARGRPQLPGATCPSTGRYGELMGPPPITVIDRTTAIDVHQMTNRWSGSL